MHAWLACRNRQSARDSHSDCVPSWLHTSWPLTPVPAQNSRTAAVASHTRADSLQIACGRMPVGGLDREAACTSSLRHTGTQEGRAWLSAANQGKHPQHRETDIMTHFQVARGAGWVGRVERPPLVWEGGGAGPAMR